VQQATKPQLRIHTAMAQHHKAMIVFVLGLLQNRTCNIRRLRLYTFSCSARNTKIEKRIYPHVYL